MGRNYWLDLFSGKTWQEFLDAGAQVSGFRDNRWATVQKIKPGDYLLCYMTGISRWIGILEVTSEPFRDSTPIWEGQTFAARVKVKPVITLTPETAVPIFDLKDKLSIFQNLTAPFAWTGYLRGSPSKWKASDGEAIVAALLEAEKNPVIHPVDQKKLYRKAPILKTKLGLVPAPEPEQQTETESVQQVQSLTSMAALATVDTVVAKEASEHDETQWLLLKMGNDMGLDVWVAQNDKSKVVAGKKFSDLPKLKKELPLQFDDYTNRTIRLIDVLWLKGNSIVAAFEIECTTSIYSGLLRMSDLIAMQPNLKIPLYIVAPDDRREKVCNEMSRPTFLRLSPPMPQMCMFISIADLKDHAYKVAPYIKHLSPDFLQDLAVSCQIEDL
jgi:predicted RNA-binding protein